jgi:hypothetical protein
VSVEAKVKRRRGSATQTAAIERALVRRKEDIEVGRGFLQGIERRTIRRAIKADRLVERMGMQERKVRGNVEEGIHKLTGEIAKLPCSGRRFRRLRRHEVRGFIAVIKLLMRRQGRLEYKLANEIIERRQIQRRLKLSDGILPLLHAGNLDRLEELLAKRRGKGGANRAARTLGLLRAQKRPYSHEHHVEIGRKGAAKRWGVKGERDGNERRDSGNAGATGDADREGVGAGG